MSGPTIITIITVIEEDGKIIITEIIKTIHIKEKKVRKEVGAKNNLDLEPVRKKEGSQMNLNIVRMLNNLIIIMMEVGETGTSSEKK